MQNKSFTLIELLVVIVIIGILAGVIIVSVSSSISKANFAKAQAFSNTVQNELLGDLVSEWTFDNPSLPGEDTWGNNDGTVTGATHKTKASGECVYGGCMSFDGNDYITQGASDDLNFGTGGLTYSVWFKNYSVDANAHIIIRSAYSANESAIGIYISNNRIYNVVRSSSTLEVAVAANVVPNNWYFVTLTRENEVIYAYLNGVNIGSASGANFNCVSNTMTRMGANSITVPNTFFNGLIDDVRIYSAALSSAQIKQQYVAGINSLLANNNISKEEYNQRLNALAYAE